MKLIPDINYHGDESRAASLKGTALSFYDFVINSMFGVQSLQREKYVGDAVIRATVWSTPYNGYHGRLDIYVPVYGGGKFVFPDITYPDRWSTYVTDDAVFYDKTGRLERKEPFKDSTVTYQAGGCLMQSISETSSPNKACIGGYWHDGKEIVSWSRYVVYVAGTPHSIDWINVVNNYSIQACSISGSNIIVITGKQQDPWDFTLTNYMYNSISVTDIKLWHYKIINGSFTLINSYFVYQSSSVCEINVGFLSNCREFYLYSRLQTDSGTKKLTKYYLNREFNIESSAIVYSTDTFDASIGIDAIINNNDGKTVVYTRNGSTGIPYFLIDNALVAIDTAKYKFIPANMEMLMFCDVKRQVYIYSCADSPYYRLSYRGVLHDIDALEITNTDDRITSGAEDEPYVYNDQFTYSYNGWFIVFCFKLYTVIIDCSKSTLAYEKHNYRFDAFTVYGGVHYTPLSLIEHDIK